MGTFKIKGVNVATNHDHVGRMYTPECKFKAPRFTKDPNDNNNFEEFLRSSCHIAFRKAYTIRRLASDHGIVDSLPVHPALPAPPTFPFLTGLLLLLFALL